MDDCNSQTRDLKRQLVAGLSALRSADDTGMTTHARGFFSYCTLSRERLARMSLPWPVIGVVLSGAKEVWRGDVAERFGTGTLFVLPSGIDLDIVNEPDERSGIYRSIFLEIEPDAVPDLGPARHRADAADTAVVPLTPALVEAMLHASRDIASGPAGAAVRTARLAELLALLHGIPAGRHLFELPLSQRVARLVRAHLDEEWTAARVAARLGMSESTLRRRLATQGQPFSVILRHERMSAAHRLMAQGAGSGAAALAVGYASRAHFARAFRATFGGNPKRDAPS
ncbi:MAG: helix-turn-helix domain-containing protein [Rhizobiales bacterium]|nr:helix-turn-helix domain-containing protein [Hyphomicrobiales bacterium]OJX98755.1 MAG: hypothetical protein BGP07_13595 [Rhizobiales bacterium 63-22]